MINQLAISLDIYLDNGTYTAKQSDADSRYLLITVTDNGTATEIESNAVVNLKARKPSGALSYDHGTVTDGKALILLTSDTLAEAGTVYCELEITQVDPVALLKTLTFKLDVKSEVYSQTIPESTSTFTALTEALATAGSIGKVSDLKTEDKSTLVAGVNEIHDEVVDLQNTKEDKSNKVTSIDSESTDTQYPSAKLTYDQLALKESNLPVTPSIPAEKFLNGNRSWATPAHNKITDLNTDTNYQHITTTQVSKLTNIEDNAEVNILEGIQIDGVDVGITSKKSNISLATSTNDGAMSSEYAGKLDGIAENANNYTHPNHTGDVTSDGDGATTIANDAVTNSKLANMTRGTVKVGGTDNAPTDLNAKTDKQILIGNGTDLTSVAVSGDVTISNLGVVTIGNDKVSNAKLSNMPTMTLKGNNTGATADPVDLTVAQTKAMLDIDDLETQLNSVPVSDTAYGLIESFENAEAGVMQDLLLKGYTSTQLVINGDFTNGTTGWTPGNSIISIVNGNMLDIGDGSTSYPFIYKLNINTVLENEKYYYKLKVRVTDIECTQIKVYISGDSVPVQYLFQQTNPVKDLWYEVSGVLSIPSGSYGNIILYIMHHYNNGATANGKTLEIDGDYGVMFINLTTTYGAGNEPDLATCQSRYPNYFDGTVSSDKGEVSVLGKNLFNSDRWYNFLQTYGTEGAQPTSRGNDGTYSYIKVYNVNHDGLQFMKGEFLPLTQYTISYIGKSVVNNSIGILVVYTDSTYDFTTAGTTWAYYSLTTDINKTVDYISTIYASASYGYFANIQLELGTTATAYEPYNPTRARYPKLQSVPAITDTFDVLGGLHTQNVQRYVLTAGDATQLITSGTFNDYVTLLKPANYIAYGDATPIAGRLVMVGSNGDTTYSDTLEKIGYISTGGFYLFVYVVAKGTYANIAAAKTALTGTVIYYQLAEPVLSYYPPKSIPLEVSSTIQHEPILSDIGFYSSGIAISDTDYPINSLQEVYKVDEETGIETPIDIASCTIAVDFLSFTSTDLTDGDLVWFRYSHSNDSTVPTTEYTYTTSLSGGLATIQQDLKKQNESLQKQIDELRAIIASTAV